MKTEKRDEQIMFWVLDDRCAGAICSTGIFVYDDSLLTIQNVEEIYLEMQVLKK